MGADTKAKTWGGGALEALDFRLRQDFQQLEQARHVFAVVGEFVAAQTANEGRDGDAGRPSVSTGADTESNTQAAAHFSSLSTPFSLMQLAMTMAEAMPSPFRERSIRSVGFVPLSSWI